MCGDIVVYFVRIVTFAQNIYISIEIVKVHRKRKEEGIDSNYII